ncbi:MAG: imidazole glycerol phosphate synthase subunit HisH [Kiritimatiellae bacterium]|nr:imidazole glycerol phosphate synthase subunit HisH [Kiritimatiellia bacterium]MBR2939144.1 imidazole glycerol phosphate synthase subunit HisH [Kiritimatiellia bacterium]
MESQEASIAIVDYGAGNLTSVKNAFAALGVETVVTRDPAVVAAAARVVFPGVGAALSAMESLRSLGLESAVKDAAASGRPFLGICLGMQILFEHSEEDGGVATLGVLPGRVRRFPKVPGVKVPQIGWNSVATNHEPRTTNHDFYYFVHSYYAEKTADTALVAEYAGVEFSAMVRRGKLWACQFHPEKSGRVGLKLLSDWLSI